MSYIYRENQQIREKKTKMRRIKRYAIIGAATGLGGVLIGKAEFRRHEKLRIYRQVLPVVWQPL
jgi:hypothetical protein